MPATYQMSTPKIAKMTSTSATINTTRIKPEDDELFVVVGVTVCVGAGVGVLAGPGVGVEAVAPTLTDTAACSGGSAPFTAGRARATILNGPDVEVGNVTIWVKLPSFAAVAVPSEAPVC